MNAGQLRAGVIGVGHLGKHHARIYHELPGATLTAVVDTDPQALERVSDAYRCEKLTTYKDIAGKVDIVTVAVPTTSHFEVASFFLENGVHVLVEKPITAKVSDGRELVRIASENQKVLMVGHSERFNPAVAAASEVISNPAFIEIHRLGPFTSRATDVDVVLDLMIHDIDLVLSWVHSSIEDIQAIGVPVLSNRIDIANARLKFQSGCIANITTSRISMKSFRKVRIFQSQTYLSIDCLNQSVNCYQKREGAVSPGDPMASIRSVPFRIVKTEPLKSEIQSFIDAVNGISPAPVPGEAGLKALEICQEISRRIRENLESNRTSGTDPEKSKME